MTYARAMANYRGALELQRIARNAVSHRIWDGEVVRWHAIAIALASA